MARTQPYSLDDLIAELKKGSYTPKSQEQMQAEAGQRYQSTYNQLRLAAEQAQQRSDLALQQQAGALQQNIGKQIEQSQKDYRLAGSQADRRLLGRGMQRSSYGAATLGNIALEGAKATDDLTSNLNARLGDIEGQRALGAQQLGDKLQQYSASQQSDILAYLDQLANQEYQRQTEADRYQNTLATQLYQFANQEQQQAAEQQRWATQFDENVRQFNAGLTEQQKAREQTQENWLKQFEESVRQNDTKMAEQIRQFNASLSLDEKKLSMSADQWERQFAEGVRQFDIKNPQGGTFTGGYPGSGPGKTAPPKEDTSQKGNALLEMLNKPASIYNQTTLRHIQTGLNRPTNDAVSRALTSMKKQQFVDPKLVVSNAPRRPGAQQ